MYIKPIKTEEDYKQALCRMEEIFDAELDTSEGDELEILSILIEKYEKDRFPIGLPDPIEAIKFRMQQLDMRQKDLAEVINDHLLGPSTFRAYPALDIGDNFV